MRKIKNIVAIATVAVMAFSMAGCKMIEKTPEAIQKTVLAKVGSDKITMADVNSELQADIDYLIETYGEDYENNIDDTLKAKLKSARQSVLEQLVDNKVLITKGTELGYIPSDEELATEIETERQNFVEAYGGEDKLKEALEHYGMSDEKFNSFLENLVKVQKVTEAITKDVTVTDEDIETYYNENIEDYTKNLIYLVSKESGINFCEDILLYEQLAFHINTTLNQLKNNVNTKNPILESIKGKYYFLFNIVLDVIKNNIYKNITEDEVGYITLYFQVSLERKSGKREDIKRISIVCPHSFGVSTLLKVKIEKRFPDIIIVETIREEDLNNNKFNKNIDFLVTLRDYIDIDIPIFITTPLFTKEDENKLKDFISNINLKDTSYNILNKLMISDYFIQEIDFDDIFEAIKYLATSLYKKHYVKEEYIQSIIDREKICPTCIGNEILLPHGDIKFVKQSILCFARLKKPIKLDNGQLISIIIMLPYKNDDREEFRELFKEIELLIDDNEMIKKLNSCNIKDIKHILI